MGDVKGMEEQASKVWKGPETFIYSTENLGRVQEIWWIMGRKSF